MLVQLHVCLILIAQSLVHNENGFIMSICIVLYYDLRLIASSDYFMATVRAKLSNSHHPTAFVGSV